ncbi:hypothetical protein ZWY2020_023408 [Hordeum vulgare]|nr:hypothetical protein ZWY2020_023408 [Hordeum vulgare]
MHRLPFPILSLLHGAVVACRGSRTGRRPREALGPSLALRERLIYSLYDPTDALFSSSSSSSPLAERGPV